MTNTIEHKIPAKIANLIHVKSPDYKIVEIVGTGVTDYYPSIDKDGKPMSCLDHTFEELFAAKVHRQRLTVRLLVDGNTVAAEEFIARVTGYKSTAISPTNVDVCVLLMEQQNA